MMAEKLLGDCNPDGKRRHVVFSGKEDFFNFQEQFEARMYKMKLLEVLESSVTVRDIEQKLEGGSHEAKAKAKERAENVMEDRKRMIWCEMVQALNKKNGLYLRPYKDGPRAWKVLCGLYRSSERPRLQCLIKLTSLREEYSETVGEYVARAEEYQYELKQVEEVTEMLTSLIMKGLSKEFDTFVTLVKFSKDEKGLEALKKDLVNFENDKRNKSKWKQFESALYSGARQPVVKCFKCHQIGPKMSDCKREEIGRGPTRSVICYECQEKGHIAKDC